MVAGSRARGGHSTDVVVERPPSGSRAFDNEARRAGGVAVRPWALGSDSVPDPHDPRCGSL